MSDDAARVKERVDIVNYIGRSVQLKKAGRNFSGLCPFHQEKSPSFNVSPDRQIFKCFGCGVSGDVITYVMQREGLSFGEALRMLGEEAGIELQDVRGKTEENTLEDRLYEMHALAAEYYHFLLVKHLVGEEARGYLEGRGIRVSIIPNQGAKVESKDSSLLDYQVAQNDNVGIKIASNTRKDSNGIVEVFKMGYSAKSWDGLGSFLIKKGFKAEEIVAGGLGVKSDKGSRGFYDMFRGRVMFPLFDKVGRIVGFSGRVLGKEKTAKYINTAETAIFHKREFLFGFFQAKEEIRRKGEVIVVEGEMDMLSSYQAGIKNVVAVKGSALTEGQIDILSKVCHRILLCFDADMAGDAAMRKAIVLAEEKEMEIAVIQVPDGKDPDECIRKDVSVWLGAIKNAVPIYDFVLQSAMGRQKENDPYGKKRVVDEVLPLFLSIKNSIVQSHYLQRLSTSVGVDERVLRGAMNKGQLAISNTLSSSNYQNKGGSIPQRDSSANSWRQNDGRNGEKTEERKNVKEVRTQRQDMEWYVMSLLVRISMGVKDMEKKLRIEDIGDKKIQKVYTVYIDFFRAHPDASIKDFLFSIATDEILPVVDELFLIDVDFEGETELKRELFVTLKHVKEMVIREEMKRISMRIKQLEQSDPKSDDLAFLQRSVSVLFEKLSTLQQM